jgi:hypothetical protein
MGESYKMMDDNGKEQMYQIIHYDAHTRKCRVVDLAKAGRPTKHIRMDNHTLLKAVRSCAVQPEAAKNADTKSTTQLYILQTGPGTYKIGCTDNLKTRMRAGRTWCSNMRAVTTRTIPKHKTSDWRRYEGKVHRRLSKKRCHRGGNEVFKLTGAELKDAIGYMNHMRFD